MSVNDILRYNTIARACNPFAINKYNLSLNINWNPELDGKMCLEEYCQVVNGQLKTGGRYKSSP